MMENERDEELLLEAKSKVEKLRDENLSRDEFIDECTKIAINTMIVKEPGVENETGFLNSFKNVFKKVAIKAYNIGYEAGRKAAEQKNKHEVH
jgi:hypothetical protein